MKFYRSISNRDICPGKGQFFGNELDGKYHKAKCPECGKEVQLVIKRFCKTIPTHNKPKEIKQGRK